MAPPQRDTINCQRCHKDLQASLSFAFRPRPAPAAGDDGSSSGSGTGTPDSPATVKCLPCSLLHRPMLKRSAIAALVVGSILTLLNQGDLLISAQWNNSLYWKIPLTYCVPFLVATYGALTNSRR